MAPSISRGVRPASLIARRAASDAIMRSERSGCWPATTPSPMIAYCPDDGCLGTVLVPPYLYKFMTLHLSSQNSPSVVPAKAGTHTPQPLESPLAMGPRLRGDDRWSVSGDDERTVITRSSP